MWSQFKKKWSFIIGLAFIFLLKCLCKFLLKYVCSVIIPPDHAKILILNTLLGERDYVNAVYARLVVCFPHALAHFKV